MYFYACKINKKETEQYKLLKVKSDIGSCFKSGKGFYRIDTYTYFTFKLRKLLQLLFFTKFA